MPIRAVIFDLDGVLADSEPWWKEIDADLLREYGVAYRGEHHRSVLGVSYPIAVEFYRHTFGITAPAEEIMWRRGQIAMDYFATRIGLFPPAKEVVEQLRQMRLSLAVATSSLAASALPFLERHGLTSVFQVIVTGDAINRGKPAPDIYLAAAEKMAVATNLCLVIEDSLAGVAAGTAAKMQVAAIPDHRFVDPQPYRAAADYVVADLCDIPPLVRKLNS